MIIDDEKLREALKQYCSAYNAVHNNRVAMCISLSERHANGIRAILGGIGRRLIELEAELLARKVSHSDSISSLQDRIKVITSERDGRAREADDYHSRLGDALLKCDSLTQQLNAAQTQSETRLRKRLSAEAELVEAREELARLRAEVGQHNVDPGSKLKKGDRYRVIEAIADNIGEPLFAIGHEFIANGSERRSLFYPNYYIMGELRSEGKYRVIRVDDDLSDHPNPGDTVRIEKILPQSDTMTKRFAVGSQHVIVGWCNIITKTERGYSGHWALRSVGIDGSMHVWCEVSLVTKR